MDAAIDQPLSLRPPDITEALLPYRGLAPATTAFDVDGVIADTMRLFIDIARVSFGIEHLRYEDITSYNLEDCLDLKPHVIEGVIEQILDGTHAPQLHAMDGCRRAMAQFGGNGQPVRFVTARPDAGIIRTWLQETLPLETDQIDVVATGSFEAKAEVLLGAGIRIFMEDRLETCFLLSEAGITPIVFVQPWNRFPHPFREVSSWEEIASMMAR